MTILNGPSTIVLKKMIREYNGDFSGGAYSNANKQFYSLIQGNHKVVWLPFYYKNREVVAESLGLNSIKIYFD